jgi:hypothetical protein
MAVLKIKEMEFGEYFIETYFLVTLTKIKQEINKYQ